MHLTLPWKTWTLFIFSGPYANSSALKKVWPYAVCWSNKVCEVWCLLFCFVFKKYWVKSVSLGWLRKAGEAYSYQVILSFPIGVRPSRFFISFSLQWRKSSPFEWCSDKAWDLLYSMWNLSYPWEAENHHIQESLQESVSITKPTFLQEQI